jgi:regulator of replication initiation timing
MSPDARQSALISSPFTGYDGPESLTVAASSDSARIKSPKKAALMANRLLSRIVNTPLERMNLHLSKQSTLRSMARNTEGLTGQVKEVQAENSRLRAENKCLREELARSARLLRAQAVDSGAAAKASAQSPSIYASALANGRDGLYVQPRHVESTKDCYFYHTMELPGLGVMAGPWDLRDSVDEYLGHVSFNGKRVLDVGTASGFLTFEAEKRGAEVVSFDLLDASSQHLLPFRDKLYFVNHEATGWHIGCMAPAPGCTTAIFIACRKSWGNSTWSLSAPCSSI